jgi:hypothetical protein
VRSPRRAIAFFPACVTARSGDIILDDVTSLLSACHVPTPMAGRDKRGQWSRWYREAIPAAERIYARHLAEIERQEGR